MMYQHGSEVVVYDLSESKMILNQINQLINLIFRFPRIVPSSVSFCEVWNVIRMADIENNCWWKSEGIHGNPFAMLSVL